MDIQNILIINLLDTGNEAESLRQVLEYMNFLDMKNIMPEFGESVSFKDEPKGGFSSEGIP